MQRTVCIHVCSPLGSLPSLHTINLTPTFVSLLRSSRCSTVRWCWSGRSTRCRSRRWVLGPNQNQHIVETHRTKHGVGSEQECAQKTSQQCSKCIRKQHPKCKQYPKCEYVCQSRRFAARSMKRHMWRPLLVHCTIFVSQGGCIASLTCTNRPVMLNAVRQQSGTGSVKLPNVFLKSVMCNYVTSERSVCSSFCSQTPSALSSSVTWLHLDPQYPPRHSCDTHPTYSPAAS